MKLKINIVVYKMVVITNNYLMKKLQILTNILTYQN